MNLSPHDPIIRAAVKNGLIDPAALPTERRREVKALFAYKRNGRGWESLGQTLRDLLIGYDLMPLRGLPETERLLLTKGSIHKVRFEPSPNGKFFALFKGDAIVTEFLSFSGMPHDRRSDAAHDALLFLDSKEFSGPSLTTCRRLFWRANKPLSRKWQRNHLAFLEGHGYSVRRVALIEKGGTK